MLVIGHVSLEVPDLEVARLFYLEGLGGGLGLKGEPGKELRVNIGASQFRLRSVTAAVDGRPGQAWPGQFYLWVADISRTLDACRALGERLGVDLVEEALYNKSEAWPDVLVLRDPAGANRFVVNAAPKALVEQMRAHNAELSAGPEAPNLLGLIDVMFTVPRDSISAVARFYARILGAGLTKKPEGYAVHFSLGESLRQTLSLAEEEEEAPTEAGEDAAHLCGCELCIYTASNEKFQQAFMRCHESGLVEMACGWEEAQKALEFRTRRCCDPGQKGSATAPELVHLVRSPDHPECPLSPSS